MTPFNPETVFEKKSPVNYSALGAKGQLKIGAVLNLLQDTAAEHASLLGISGFDLAVKGLAWVIAKYRIDLFSTPSWLEELTIATWRSPWKNLYDLRDFQVTGQNRESIVTATAGWVMVKKSNNRPVRLNRHLAPDLMTPCDHEGTRGDPFHDIEKIETTHVQLPFKIRMEDLDLNRHVNNTVYVGWALETVTEEILENFRPCRIDVVFHKAAFYGDGVLSKTEIRKEKNAFLTLHAIRLGQSDKELATINITWTPF
ncbi:MAG TPA: acyl-ACP thioesterase domain-containing protein [Desulfobacteraceae bacterium]|nr:acyl-ACP thioesterase domain-containing protein [Desulfobacteraceae bacterium]